MIPAIELKIAQTPKASGPYRRVRMGDARIMRIWANVVPVTRIEMSFANVPFLEDDFDGSIENPRCLISKLGINVEVIL